jgi:hypothetical protein
MNARKLAILPQMGLESACRPEQELNQARVNAGFPQRNPAARVIYALSIIAIRVQEKDSRGGTKN